MAKVGDRQVRDRRWHFRRWGPLRGAPGHRDGRHRARRRPPGLDEHDKPARRSPYGCSTKTARRSEGPRKVTPLAVRRPTTQSVAVCLDLTFCRRSCLFATSNLRRFGFYSCSPAWAATRQSPPPASLLLALAAGTSNRLRVHRKAYALSGQLVSRGGSQAAGKAKRSQRPLVLTTSNFTFRLLAESS